MEEEFKVRDVAEVIKDAKEDRIKLIQKGEWGHWKYNPDNLTLEIDKVIDGHHHRYYIDFERCNNSAQILDWIFQIKHKPWCSDEDIADLLRAFDALLHTVQGRVCSGGIDHQFDCKKYLIEEVNPIIKKSSK